MCDLHPSEVERTRIAHVCNDLKAGVNPTRRCEPGLNRTYQDKAAHFGTAILPARARRPRDKANVKVEVAAQVVQRWVSAWLRHRRLFFLAELNGAIRAPIADLINRWMCHLGTTHRDLFETSERDALLPIPIRMPTRSGGAVGCRWTIKSRSMPLLLRALSPDARGHRGPDHRPDHRAVPS
jgi:hypothetical protein